MRAKTLIVISSFIVLAFVLAACSIDKQKVPAPIIKLKDHNFNPGSTAVSHSQSNHTWIWPTQGKIIKCFGQRGGYKSNGIAISARQGQVIKAVRDGVVDFSGDGGYGYGNMVIIKHKYGYLSVYSHNQKLLVKTDQKVKQGQAIATMGKTDNGKVELYFELRQDGRPVNPLDYLPNQGSNNSCQ